MKNKRKILIDKKLFYTLKEYIKDKPWEDIADFTEYAIKAELRKYHVEIPDKDREEIIKKLKNLGYLE